VWITLSWLVVAGVAGTLAAAAEPVDSAQELVFP
jgi:hypothetical protein